MILNKIKNRFFGNNLGFSILETLVGIGLLSILAAGVASLFIQSKVKTASLLSDADTRNIFDKIRITLNDRAACSMTFKTVGNVLPDINMSTASSSTVKTVNNILAANGAPLYETGRNYGNDNIRLQSMQVDLWLGKTAAPDSIGQFRLKIDLEKLDRNSVGSSTKTFYMLLGAKVSATNNVIDCYSYLDDEYLLRNGSNIMTGQLVVSSTALGINVSNGWAQANYFLSMSDRRLKHNITNIPNHDKIIQQVRGVQFNWNIDRTQDFGFVAQDLEKVVPHAVKDNAETGFKSVNYSTLLPALVEKYKLLIQESKTNQIEIELLLKKTRQSTQDTLTQ